MFKRTTYEERFAETVRKLPDIFGRHNALHDFVVDMKTPLRQCISRSVENST